MTEQFFCKNRDRWKKVLASSTINGIDYLEISSADQLTIKLFFLHNLPGQTGGIPASPILTKDNIFIEGGARIKNIRVQSILATENILTVLVDKTGDFSNYTLSIGHSSTEEETAPDGFDEQLSEIVFSFKINCPNEFDCATSIVCPPDKADEPSIDYLAKDYASFNRLMLDRMSTIIPDWAERHPADFQVALIEMLAYMGDHLSYYQDAVATEAYLNTARRRISLKRHARLLDYFVHDGCNARVLAHIDLEKKGSAEGLTITQGTPVMTNGTEDKVTLLKKELAEFLSDRDPVVFETMHQLTLNSAHNQISFYTWADDNCCLPSGATTATLADADAPASLTLSPGDVLIFEELYSPSTGKKADADISHRHAVRLKNVQNGITDKLTGQKIVKIEWYDKDALPFSLCLTSSVENEDNMIPVNEKSVARGNNVMADHGMTKTGKNLQPEMATEGEIFYPRLPDENITVAVGFDFNLEKTLALTDGMKQDPHDALQSVLLMNASQIWEPQHDLLGSDRFASEFVVEMEQDGTSYLRFGDDVMGRKPDNGFSPTLRYRAGNGRMGNIGSETINTLLWEEGGITKIRNPLAANGGQDPETMEEVRQFAPQAFRTQERAVTQNDYEQKTELHPEVQKAAARFYWTGSWYTVYIIIDRKQGKEIDDNFKQEIINHLEQFRMAGYDLEIKSPVFVSLYIILDVCVKQGYFRTNIKQGLLRVFSNGDLPGGGQGFFHPDRFTFGQPVYLSAIYKAAMSVEGVASVQIKEFRRWAKNPVNEIEEGLLQPSELEILRLDNDPNFPENGKIDFIMSGGL